MRRYRGRGGCSLSCGASSKDVPKSGTGSQPSYAPVPLLGTSFAAYRAPFLSYKPLFSCPVCRRSCAMCEGSLRAQVARCLGFEALPASYGANSRIGRKSAVPLPSAAPLPGATLWRSAWLRASLGARRCGWWSRGGRILVSGGRNRGSHVGLRP